MKPITMDQGFLFRYKQRTSMAVAEWFFSTLAQSTAAIIGFTIALAAALYTSRLEKIRHQTESLRDQLIEIQDEYQPVLSGISTTLLEDGNFSTDGISSNIDAQGIIEDSHDTEEAAARIQYQSRGLDATTEEIEEWAVEQSDVQAALLWAHNKRTNGLLGEISPLTENLLTPDQMGEIMDSIRVMKNTLDANNESAQTLYEEITGDDAGQGFHTEDIFSETESVERWIDRNLQDYNRRHVGFEIPDSIATGRNISNWATMFEEFERDVGLAGGSALDSKIISNPRSNIKEFLKLAAMLGLVGIFIPLMFLIVSPNSQVMILDSSVILWSQILTLAASAILSGLLIRSLFDFLRKSMT